MFSSNFCEFVFFGGFLPMKCWDPMILTAETSLTMSDNCNITRGFLNRGSSGLRSLAFGPRGGEGNEGKHNRP